MFDDMVVPLPCVMVCCSKDGTTRERSMNITVVKNENTGKYFGMVHGDYSVAYETPEYYLSEMAHLDARCWRTFHMEPEFVVEDDDTVYNTTGSSLTGAKFKELIADLRDVTEISLRHVASSDADDAFNVEIYNDAKGTWRLLATVHKA